MSEPQPASAKPKTTRYLIEVEDASVQVITYAIDVPEGEDPADVFYVVHDEETEEVSRRTVRSNWEVIGTALANEVVPD